MSEQASPDPIYGSWVDYLATVSWVKLRRRCLDTAKRANRARLLSAAAKHRVTGLQVWHVMRHARGRCTHCGSLAVEGRPSDPHKGSPVAWAHLGRRIGSLEHSRPRFGGGDNDQRNLAWSCLWCNTWPDERRRGAADHGGHHPALHREPGAKQSDAILAAKYAATTGKVWSATDAFAPGPRPAAFDDRYEDYGFEMFPDHECPWDIAMIRNA
jgi:hypothetical protein